MQNVPHFTSQHCHAFVLGHCLIVEARSRSFAPLLCNGIYITATLLILLGTKSVSAQTFNETIVDLLAQDPITSIGCVNLAGDSPLDQNSGAPLNFGPQLTDICSQAAPPTGSDAVPNSSAGGQASTGSQAEQVAKRRIHAVREGESSEVDAVTSVDTVKEITSGVNMFISGQYETLDREETAFELGYESDKWGVTAGIDFQPTDWAVTGLAVNYFRWEGDFLTDGEFQTDTYGTVVYASVFPWEGMFADMVFQYSRKSSDADKIRTYTREDDKEFTGTINGAPDANEYELNVVLGYDYPIKQFTIGPRLRLRYQYMDIDAYTESGSTGLELLYLDDSINNLQTALGFQATAAFSTNVGVVVPQISADWTHEFKNDQRFISAQFVQDNRPTPTIFSFQTDKPDRDFFHASIGVAFVLPNGLQTFVNIEALLEHDFFDNYVGTVGIRAKW